ncbi:TPA: hypothetical protein ACGPBJ_001318 [Streptococcus suis]
MTLSFGKIAQGYLDAENEALYNSDKFESIFFDLNGIFDQLNILDSPTSLLIGRKGVGKSAYAARLGIVKGGRRSIMLKLSEVPYREFTKISDNKGNSLGTQRYLQAWYLMLLSSVVKKLNNDDVKSPEILQNLIELLEYLGITRTTDIIRDILTASKKEFKVKVNAFELQVGSEGKDIRKFINLTDMTSYFLEEFIKLEIKVPVYVVIDGIDDILRIKKDTQEILSGLVRAVYSLNQRNYKRNAVKFILVIRDDIVKTINDPDMNKIIQDTGELLNWYSTKNSQVDNLIQLFNNRILATNKEYSLSVKENQYYLWNYFFPFKIRGLSSWDYFLEYTMYRPRDVVQFVNQFIKKYKNSTSVTREMFNDELRIFSQDYFYEEMRNELLGFLSEEIIDGLFDILQKLGSQNRDNFVLGDLMRLYSENYPNYSTEEIKNILNTLFNAGYVGMLRTVNQRGNTKNYVNFKHKDPRLKIDYSSKFIIHKGLFSALNI